MFTVYEGSTLSNNVNINVDTTGTLTLEKQNIQLTVGDNWNNGYINLTESHVTIDKGLNGTDDSNLEFAFDIDNKIVGDENSSLTNNALKTCICALFFVSLHADYLYIYFFDE
jgi:hypothetical protein